MKKVNLTLSAKQILDYKFPGVPSGYDPYLVDEFLDKIIKDYSFIESNNLISEEDYKNLVKENEELKEKVYNLELENGKYSLRLQNIKDDDVVTSNNIELLKRINHLEKLLYKHKIDPNEK